MATSTHFLKIQPPNNWLLKNQTLRIIVLSIAACNNKLLSTCVWSRKRKKKKSKHYGSGHLTFNLKEIKALVCSRKVGIIGESQK